VLTLGLGGGLRPVWVEDAEAVTRALRLSVRRVGASGVEEYVLARQDQPQDDSEDFVYWIVFVRPGERAQWAPSRGRLRADAVRWMAKHARQTKELFHETRENYAPGLAALDAMLYLLQGPMVSLLDGAEVSEATRARLNVYLADFFGQLAAGREVASRALVRWADELGEFEDTPCEDVGACRGALLEAAAAWGASGALVGEAGEVGEVRGEAQLKALAGVLRSALSSEEAAGRALARAAPLLKTTI
jgi:hypothetical protein